MSGASGAIGVFINCPYDDEYTPFFQAAIFTVTRCGFNARSAAEVVGSAKNRIDKIMQIISECPLGIHDISRTELDPKHKLPRFNMPFELGLFLGARYFGNGVQKKKDCIVLDINVERYHYSLSDLKGQDIAAHGNDPQLLVTAVRDFLNSHSSKPLPDGEVIWGEYQTFRGKIPEICTGLELNPARLEFRDFAYIVSNYVSLSR